MNGIENTIEAPSSRRETELAADPAQWFYRRMIDLLRLPAPATDSQAIGMLVYVGPADPSGVERLRASLSPSTFLLWLYPPDSGLSPMPEQPLPGTRTLTCPLSDESFYSDRIGLLIAVIPQRRVDLRVSFELETRCAKQISRIKTAIRTALENHSNHLTRGLIRLRCSLRNLPVICATPQKPRSVPPGCSAIICGAGPSLSSQMDILRRIADRATIIAVGHAVPALVGAGIMPHMVVEGDSMAYQNWPAELRADSLLVAPSEVSPEVAARFNHILWCYGCSMLFNVAATSWSLPLREVTLNRTVTVHAIDFAVRLGFDRIALVGQDLSISETGRLHAAGECVDGDEHLVDLPGNEGGRVLATVDLAGLREALEQYLVELGHGFKSSGRQVLIGNCTHGGAVIGGTLRMTLNSFCEGIPTEARLPMLYEPDSPVAPPRAKLAALSAGLRNYIAVAGDIARCCTRLGRDLTALPFDGTRVRRRQDELRALMQKEEAARADETIGLWVHSLLEYVDEQLKKSPGLVSDSIDPHIQLRFLHTRYDMAADLCSEIRQDIDQACARLGAAGLSPTGTSPYLFNTFRRQALRFIGGRNKDLARLLEQRGFASVAHRFRAHWINQLIPYVKMARPPNSWVPLNNFASMFEQSRADVERFLDEAHVSTGRCGVTCVAPGNWAHVIQLAIRFPSLPLIVIEPWPDLLSMMMERGMFLHLLPADTLILGAHDELPGWKDLYGRRVGEWAAQGIENVLWKHPRADRLPDVPALFERLRELAPAKVFEEIGPAGELAS